MFNRKPTGMSLEPGRREVKMRRILETVARSASWADVPQKFYSCMEMSFEAGGVTYRASVTFDHHEICVFMTEPVVTCARRFICYPSLSAMAHPFEDSLFVGGVEGAPATERCVNIAKELFVGLFCDYVLLLSTRDHILEKYREYKSIEQVMISREMTRLEILKKRILELSVRSGEIKGRFKRGEIRQDEYISLKKPVHEEIVALQRDCHMRDVFSAFFGRELDECVYTEDRKNLLRQVIGITG